MRVVHCMREKYTHYIGRGKCPQTGEYGKYGNLFTHKEGTLAKFKCKSREEAVIRYKHYAVNTPQVLEWIKNLPEDAVLGCWCAPQDCHGYAIKEIWEEINVSV